MNLPVGCSLNCSKMNIFCYADDIVLLAPTAQALQVMLDSLSGTIRSLSLKINIQKSCHIVFRHKKRKIDSDVKIDNQMLKTVTECKYLGVVLSDDLSCTKDVERAKACFFKQFYSLHNKFHCMDQKVLIHLFKLHAMSFYGVEIWFMKLHTKDLNNISIVYHKYVRSMCNRKPYGSSHDCLERVKVPVFIY